MISECSKCGVSFERHKVQGSICKPCEAKYQRLYMREYRKKNATFEAERFAARKANPEWVAKERKRGREYWAKLRHEAIMAYGGYRCTCCGETEPKFLALDHVFNDGSKHRKEIKNRGSGIFKWLKDHNYPGGFQILCMNCNHGKSLNNGICPHKAGQSHENCVKTGEVQTG